MANAVHIGCPVWAHAPWVGRFFTAEARREDFLPQYASVFDTAEGNSTFYGLPSVETVRRWAAEAPSAFRFCFKFPRTVSHDRRLAGAGAETAEFLARLEPLGARLGPFFIQVHPSFGPPELPVLAGFLRGLPREFAYAVEVRHRGFFDEGAGEAALNRLLGECGVDRVTFDTRGLFASKADDPVTLDAKRKKPRVPVRFTATGRRPFVRFVGDPDVPANRSALAAWARQLATWVAEGREPYFFTHHPEDTHAPALGRLLQGLVHEVLPAMPAAPAWPAERTAPAAPTQLGLW